LNIDCGLCSPVLSSSFTHFYMPTHDPSSLTLLIGSLVSLSLILFFIFYFLQQIVYKVVAICKDESPLLTRRAFFFFSRSHTRLLRSLSTPTISLHITLLHFYSPTQHLISSHSLSLSPPLLFPTHYRTHTHIHTHTHTEQFALSSPSVFP
jgi:hypothetical protein